MRPVFCFIDDSAFELEVFAKNIVPAAPGLDFILTATHDQAHEKLGPRYPALFILDLYGRDPALPAKGVPTKEELAAEIDSMASLDAIYEGLEDFPGDKVNEFLKRMFHLMDTWRQLFSRVFRASGQNINYGLGNLEAARQNYPCAAAVAYTRKSMISDAVEVLAAGMDGLNLKPDGPDDEAIHRATNTAAPELLKSWSGIVTRRFTSHFQRLAIFLVSAGLESDTRQLREGAKLSPEARKILGSGYMNFLKAAADWWTYTGQKPSI